MVNDTGTFWSDLLFWFLFIIKQAGFFLFVNSDNGGMNEFIVLLRLKIKYMYPHKDAAIINPVFNFS